MKGSADGRNRQQHMEWHRGRVERLGRRLPVEHGRAGRIPALETGSTQ
jgi:hypothetical protein